MKYRLVMDKRKLYRLLFYHLKIYRYFNIRRTGGILFIPIFSTGKKVRNMIEIRFFIIYIINSPNTLN